MYGCMYVWILLLYYYYLYFTNRYTEQFMAKDTEQFKKGHSNGRLLGSATGTRGIKRRLEYKNNLTEIQRYYGGRKICMFNCVRAHMRGRFEINPYQRATFVFHKIFPTLTKCR